MTVYGGNIFTRLGFGYGELHRVDASGANADHFTLFGLPIYLEDDVIITGFVAVVDHVGGDG